LWRYLSLSQVVSHCPRLCPHVPIVILPMRRTHILKACIYLASKLKFQITTKGKTWSITEPECYTGLGFSPESMLATLMRNATSPLDTGGLGWDGETLAKSLRRVTRTTPRPPTHMTATDAATWDRIPTATLVRQKKRRGRDR
jgi:hypothetical protein